MLFCFEVVENWLDVREKGSSNENMRHTIRKRKVTTDDLLGMAVALAAAHTSVNCAALRQSTACSCYPYSCLRQSCPVEEHVSLAIMDSLSFKCTRAKCADTA